MRSICRASVGWMAALLLLGSAQAAAQDVGMLSGRVLDDSTGDAIGGARVQLLSGSRRVLYTTTATDSGDFQLPIRRRGVYRLRASRLGFREAVTPPMAVDPGDAMAVEVRLTTGRVLLAPLQVVARPAARRHRSPGLDDFRNRMASSIGGHFVTREDVDKRRPSRLTDLLTSTGLVVTGNSVYFPRQGCPPHVYIDGVLMTRHTGGRRGYVTVGQNPYEVINMVWSGDVEGVEVYHGRASLPAEFGGPGSECGVVAIWTRRFEP